MALGAARSQIRSLVVHQVVRVVLAGIVGGSLMIAGIGPLMARDPDFAPHIYSRGLDSSAASSFH
jgi:hypothetical protein